MTLITLPHFSKRDHPSKKGMVEALVTLSILEDATVASIPSIWKFGGVTRITLLHFSSRASHPEKRMLEKGGGNGHSFPGSLWAGVEVKLTSTSQGRDDKC